ncbi:MAG: radical SAM protein [Pseudomonadota bacterium]
MSSIASSNLKRISPRASPRAGKKSFPFEIDQVWLDQEVADHPQAIRILNKLPDVPVDIVEKQHSVKRMRDIGAAKRQLFLTMHRGQAFKPCQGISGGQLCCGYRVIDLTSGCPMDCSYCVLQSYLANNPVTAVYVNIESILAEVSAFLSAHQNRFFRIGTGELSDSLALDPLTDCASVLIPFFASRRNAMLELKTKSAAIDHLMGLRHRNRTVIAWSVNTPEIISSEERGTASLDDRLAAAQKAASAGYGVGFHLDPIILARGAEDVGGYLDVIERILGALEPKQISWVSLGLLRYPSDLQEIATRRFPNTKIFSGELVPSLAKVRYPRFVREAAYRPLWKKLRSKLPPHKLYLCMETPAIWEKIDPSVTTSACIEKRLCNTEAIPFDYRA